MKPSLVPASASSAPGTLLLADDTLASGDINLQSIFSGVKSLLITIHINPNFALHIFKRPIQVRCLGGIVGSMAFRFIGFNSPVNSS